MTRALDRLAADAPDTDAVAETAAPRDRRLRATARLEADAQAAAETAALESLVTEVAKKDNARADFLRSLMPLISGTKGKRLVEYYKDGNGAGFSALFEDIKDQMVEIVDPEFYNKTATAKLGGAA